MPVATPSVEAVLARYEADTQALKDNWCMPKAACQFLNMVMRLKKAQHVCEVGTSIGYSTLYIAAALAESGGILETIDVSEERQSVARANILEAGLSERVRFHLGEALSALEDVIQAGPLFDVVFLDARKDQYLAYVDLLRPVLAAGAMIVADNTMSHREALTPYRQAMLEDAAFNSFELETPSGLFISEYLGG
jgi:caffeoyl-CoA O-methyltransferase